jgi:hypothetical protein
MTPFVPPEHDARRIPSRAADAAGPLSPVTASPTSDTSHDNEKTPHADAAEVDLKGAAAPEVGTLHRSLKSRHV